jgi:hypothetical protein
MVNGKVVGRDGVLDRRGRAGDGPPGEETCTRVLREGEAFHNLG